MIQMCNNDPNYISAAGKIEIGFVWKKTLWRPQKPSLWSQSEACAFYAALSSEWPASAGLRPRVQRTVETQPTTENV